MNWNTDPPADFCRFVQTRWEKEELEDEQHCREKGKNWRPTTKPNPVTLWNSDSARQEFYRYQGKAETPPEPEMELL